MAVGKIYSGDGGSFYNAVRRSGIKKEVLASDMGISNAKFFNLYNKFSFSLEEKALAAKALGLSVSDLFADSPDPVKDILLPKQDRHLESFKTWIKSRTKALRLAINDEQFVEENSELFSKIFLECYERFTLNPDNNLNSFAKSVGIDKIELDNVLAGGTLVRASIIVALFDQNWSEYEDILSKKGKEIVKRYLYNLAAPFTDPGITAVPMNLHTKYSQLFSNVEFINSLERINIPGSQFSGEDFRFFQMDGDGMWNVRRETGDMIGIQNGEWILTEKISGSINALDVFIEGVVYVVITNRGIIIGRAKLESGSVSIADDYDVILANVNPSEVSEIWKAKRYLRFTEIIGKIDGVLS